MAMKKGGGARRRAGTSAAKPAARSAAKRGVKREVKRDVKREVKRDVKREVKRDDARRAKTAAKTTAKTTASASPAAPPAVSSGASTILYVHGIGNKPLASVLKAQWDKALFEFDLGERSRLAYWVDRDRYPIPEAGAASGGDYSDASADAPAGAVSPRTLRHPWDPQAELAGATGEVHELFAGGEAGPNSKEAVRLASLAARLLTEGALADDTRYEARAARLQGAEGADARRIRAQRYGAAAVEAKVFGFLPRPLRQWMTRTITRMLLRDVHDLFVDKAKGERMKDAVRERLRAGGAPFVIVAHSQGSMIAYSVLMEPEFATLDLPLLVTIGSPLGIDEVQDFLKEHTGQQRLHVPPAVRQWINVSDPLDPVALDKRLESDYAPNAQGTKVESSMRFNPDSLRHPHSATGYLALEEVRVPVRQAVNTSLFQPVARFALARDVVRTFADAASQERHRILVQLADFATAKVTREEALKRIFETVGAAEPSSPERDLLEPEELQRYVALSLTRAQAEELGSKAIADRNFPIARVWKNGVKWAYLDSSIHSTQAHPAHNSYHAAGAGITWAVLDSGIHWTHPHFGADGTTIDRVFDCTHPRRRPAAERNQLRELARGDADDLRRARDTFGHGAHVAGIIAGRHTARDATGRERAMCGMAPESRLVIYKVLDGNGSGEDSWIIRALDHVFETNERAGQIVIHGVNLSLGGEFDVEAFNCGHTPLCVELRRLWRQGVIVVVAAGNEGFASLSAADGDSVPANMSMSLGDPANLEEAIVVGSVHKDAPHTYGLSYFSSRGPTADGRMKPDCVAPGERILSVRNDAPADAGAAFEELYAEMSGTSMAAPHVSGLIAAFLSRRREFIGYPDLVKEILLKNCTDLERQRTMQGAGMPNLVRMLVNV